MVTIEGGSFELPAWMEGLKGIDNLKVIRKRVTKGEGEGDGEGEGPAGGGRKVRRVVVKGSEADLDDAEIERLIAEAEAAGGGVICREIRLSAEDLEGDPADDAPSDDGTFRIQISLPGDLRSLAERMDPLIGIYTVASAIGELDGKLGELARLARAQGKTWTEIGTAAGTSKQAAWERFSGEE